MKEQKVKWEENLEKVMRANLVMYQKLRTKLNAMCRHLLNGGAVSDAILKVNNQLHNCVSTLKIIFSYFVSLAIAEQALVAEDCA